MHKAIISFTITFTFCFITLAQNDNDGDTIYDINDLDDDNDGIYDTDEGLIDFASTLAPRFITNDVTLSDGESIDCGTGYATAESTVFQFDISWGNGTGASLTSTSSVLDLSINGTNYFRMTTPQDGSVGTDNATDLGGDAFIENFSGSTYTNDTPSSQGTNYLDHSTEATIVLTVPVIITDYSFLATLQGDDFRIRNIYVVNGCGLDTDDDSVPNYLDTDSDNDGCSDADEAYGLEGTDGDDGEEFGTGNPPSTNTDGTVVGASYTPANTANTQLSIELTEVTPVTDVITCPTGQAFFSTDYTAALGLTYSSGNITTSSDETSNLQYQWYYSTDGGITYSTITPTASNGADSYGLTVRNGDTEFGEGYMYYVVVSHPNKICTENSTIATLDFYDSSYTDSDSDEIPDICDLDDDNDGIYDSDECPTLGVNGDFELPVLTTSYVTIDQSLVPGWETTSSANEIEIWTDGFVGVPAYEGNQFAEVNANGVDVLYQTLTGTSGLTLNINFAHRARNNNTESIIIEQGPPGSTTYTQIAQFYGDTTMWQYHSVEVDIPVGQDITEIRFSNGHGTANGNFIDAFTFTTCESSNLDTI